MNNFGQNLQRTSILKELSDGNAELGEGFAQVIDNMVMQSGITNPKGETYEIVTRSWKNLASNPDKTPEDIKKLDVQFKSEINTLAASYLLYMAREVGNLTGKLDYFQYETFVIKHRFSRYDTMNKPEYMAQVKQQIRNAFNKIANHGEETGDNLIDKKDMAAYIYALATKTKRDENNNFVGYEIDGILTPEAYAVSENMLFRNDDNMISIKIRLGYKMMFGE
ncbi:MAG: hypothetical protein E7Z87_00490 [Cyanobacteria bacterium SIG26]|nr:hypothetical protein [Cyanobacteria bacterium SIG26]